MSEQQDWRRCFERLREALTSAQSDRDKRQEVYPSGEVAWVVHEREVMHAEVNRLRADMGRAPVTEHLVRRAEQMACGHSDYTAKFALYCADVAMGAER